MLPLCALWANLHGGFVALLATLAVCAAGGAVAALWAADAGVCGATLVNPYGWRLHAHIVEYLRSSWILDHVQEFQSPNIRSENMVVFAVLLLAAAALALRASGSKARWHWRGASRRCARRGTFRSSRWRRRR